MVIPVEITIFEDRSFNFVTKTPPAADLIKKAAGVDKGSAMPHRNKVGTRQPRPGARDRRDQDEGPQRDRPRGRRADDRGHRPQHGRACGVGDGRARQELRRGGQEDRPFQLYTPQEAVALLRETSYGKFDPTVEVHIRTGVDPRHADQMIRGSVVLPGGHGQDRSACWCSPRARRPARPKRPAQTSSAATTWSSEIQGGWLDFDVAVATPDMMGMVGRLGRVLGPRGLMPNPRTGTVIRWTSGA